jgi:TolB-like protein
MKRFILMLCVFSLTAPQAVSASQLDAGITKAFDRLAEAYNKQYPAGGMKKGLAVLPLEEKSELAKSKGLGTTVREIVSRQAVKSSVFYLIDRDALEASLKEAKLSMLGLVDDNSITEAGKLIGVQVFVTGSISEAGGSFSISLKLVDSQTGRVVAMESVDISKKKLLEIRKELAFQTIEQYGLGINMQISRMFMDAPYAPDISMLTDVYVNYRPFLWLNFKAGVTTMTLEFGKEGLSTDKIFPELSDDAVGGNSQSIYGGMTSIRETTFLIGADYNWIVTEWLNFAFGISFNLFERPQMRQIFDGSYTDINEDGTLDTGEETQTGFKCIHHFESVNLVRFEFKPQIIIIPRLTLGFVAGYILANDLKVEYSEIGNDMYSQKYSDSSIDKYFGISNKNFMDGKNVEDIKFNGAWYLGMNVNFFF